MQNPGDTHALSRQEKLLQLHTVYITWTSKPSPFFISAEYYLQNQDITINAREGYIMTEGHPGNYPIGVTQSAYFAVTTVSHCVKNL